MKIIRLTTAATALFSLAAILPVYGQHQENQRNDNQKNEEKEGRDQPRRSPEGRQNKQQPQAPARPQRMEQTHSQPVTQARQEPQRSTQQAQAWQQQKGWAQHGGGSVGHATFAQSRSGNWSADHRSWAQRGGYGGYYIPQDRFRLSFGVEHFFRLGGLPNMYMGYPRFAYGGFSFLMLDPWPSDWSENWYASDDVYIDYEDGYYLHNRRFPQQRLAITIAL